MDSQVFRDFSAVMDGSLRSSRCTLLSSACKTHANHILSRLPPYAISELVSYRQSTDTDMKQQDFNKQIRDLKEGKIDALAAKASHPTVFAEMLHGNLPPEEKKDRRLRDEAQLIISAGVATTGWSMSVCTSYLLSNPEFLAKLREDLVSAIPGQFNSSNPTENLE